MSREPLLSDADFAEADKLLADLRRWKIDNPRLWLAHAVRVGREYEQVRTVSCLEQLWNSQARLAEAMKSLVRQSVVSEADSY